MTWYVPSVPLSYRAVTSLGIGQVYRCLIGQEQWHDLVCTAVSQGSSDMAWYVPCVPLSRSSGVATSLFFQHAALPSHAVLFCVQLN
ncbi:hypothetical protein NP493_420g05002 [Ridgeia piscesae]|uniref:Uncharacterized protein n=1 Tax=Ridgeia piscesae TaxID=27915 RepID=A0AAD9NVC6_RIDPI|nr:hypothetical protein NP493_420g05002 [Ridgeia piscesae]